MKLNLTTTPTSSSYEIVVEKGALAKAGELIGIGGKSLILTDSGVPAQYSRTVADILGNSLIYTIPQGEENKNVSNWTAILSFLVEHGFTRTDRIIAVGGGVIGDLAGFVASTFMRGISFYNIPTTLLSQVDSSIGGKTAIDFCGVKNIVGAFYQPKMVIIDPLVLNTLSDRELHSGLVEAVKMAATFDEDLFTLIENSTCLSEDLERIITRSLELKRMVVEQDTTEKGLRKVLNFGHTVGHAIEAAAEGKYLHGESVGMGMLYFCSDIVRGRIKNVLEKYALPVECEISREHLAEYIAHDKKASGSDITIIAVNQIGSFEMKSVNVKQVLGYEE